MRFDIILDCISLRTHGLRMPNEAFFSLKSQTFGLWHTNWAYKFWGIFGRTVSAYFNTVSPFSMLFIIKPLLLQKLSLDLNLGHKELGI